MLNNILESIPEEEQGLNHLPSPLEILVQASQRMHYFAQADNDCPIEGTADNLNEFSSFLNTIRSYDEK